MQERPYSYVAYIDEAGDDGLTRVRPIDENGSSEWLIISGVVIKASREEDVRSWVGEIRAGLRNRQARIIHFSKLSDPKRTYVCERLAELSARYFVVCSNKKNMRGYRNPLAEQIPSSNWFYCWMTRVLLERITDFVRWHSMKEFGAPKKVKVEYSNRGGLSYPQMSAYYRWISYQGENTVLRNGKIRWDVVDYDLLRVYPHYERAGLQLADVVASSFFKACDIYQTGSCDPSYAKLLRPRIAKYRDAAGAKPAGYGVKLLPTMPTAALRPVQQDVFRYYGYPEQWWDPDPSDPWANRSAS